MEGGKRDRQAGRPRRGSLRPGREEGYGKVGRRTKEVRNE